MTMGIGIHINATHLSYSTQDLAVLKNLKMTLAAQQWTCLLGRSGCGKTSILRKLAGLLEEAHWQGDILTEDGQPLVGRIAYMAQQDLLLPWLSALDNVCVGHRLQGQTITENVRQRALDMLAKVDMLDHAEKRPQALSGGMRQRVALARTLMQDRPVVLMDEPFSALDAVTRHKLQTLAYELLHRKTVVLVTHDPQEAVRLAHHIYVFEGQPATARALECLPQHPPRVLNGDTAAMQSHILDQLERDHA